MIRNIKSGNGISDWMAFGAALLLCVTVVTGAATTSSAPAEASLNAKVERFDASGGTLDDAIRIFDEPERYLWGRETFKRSDLPAVYLASWPGALQIVFKLGAASELRFEGESDYVFDGRLRVGSTLDEAIAVLGEPDETVEGKKLGFEDGVLYKDIDGRKGHCYYARADKGVRVFFGDNRVAAIYLPRGEDAARGGMGGIARSVKPYDDVRGKDLSRLDLSERDTLPTTLQFNLTTTWPPAEKLPKGFDPKALLESAKDPGLGVRALHKQGITGKGVNVAIIDQPISPDHPEYKDRIAAYHDVGCGTKTSMHGPAVLSLLAGKTCGTAPGAKVYYVAAPSWTADTAYQAKALDWLVLQNINLMADRQIRVVAVSAMPSGKGSPFTKNTEQWDAACERATRAGILVLDCTEHRGLIGSCYFGAGDRQKPADCRPGYPGLPGAGWAGRRLLVPTCPRTTAEEYVQGDFSYVYWGRGGLSWAIPYAAGVLAMGWQVDPTMSAERAQELLIATSHDAKTHRIIDPVAFIHAVKRGP